jgi:hypothetical protein
MSQIGLTWKESMSMKEQGSLSTSGDGGTEELMKHFGLHEEDLDDVVFQSEGPPPAEATRWMIITRVHMESEYSTF